MLLLLLLLVAIVTIVGIFASVVATVVNDDIVSVVVVIIVATVSVIVTFIVNCAVVVGVVASLKLERHFFQKQRINRGTAQSFCRHWFRSFVLPLTASLVFKTVSRVKKHHYLLVILW